MAKKSKKKKNSDKRDDPKTNPNGANQFLLDPRQLKCWSYYVNPKSKTFGNATQSAIRAGYEPDYADQITTVEWFKGKVRRLNLLSKAEIVLEDTLDMPHVVPAMGAFGPIVDKKTKKPVLTISAALLKIKQDSAKFVAETQGKSSGYSKKTELGLPEDEDGNVQGVVILPIKNATSSLETTGETGDSTFEG